MNDTSQNEHAIAVIGLAGRFPGAANVDALWHNLEQGVESITFFDDATLLKAGIDAATLARPDFVKASPFIPGIDLFDAYYFGINPAEAEQMDPQHRLFLECCVTALEDATIVPDRFEGSVGIFGGSGVSTYWSHVNQAAAANNSWSSTAQAAIGNIQDYLCSRVAYKLNLKGPCYTVQSACSTSLVAVHLASQHLQNFECDVALAGGVSITVPEVSGYFYQENGIVSPDGHCRPFDAQAAGTIFGSGMGVVVLKRLTDALADRDPIHAVILGSAINNDGALKAAYTAPSVTGQSRAITEALAMAEISPETIAYVEGHGTATQIGDPIEVSALTQAYRLHTQKKQYCALGSIKSNLGHLDTAAGIAGFIKTVLSLKHKTIAPTLHFESANPKIRFEDSPFYVSSAAQAWPEHLHPCRAAVSSFGVGGSNAHVILEEAPSTTPSSPSKAKQILFVSAKTETALEHSRQDLADHLDEHPETCAADILATLSQGRSLHAHRFAAVCSTEHADAIIDLLDEAEGTETFTAQAFAVTPKITFLFPGQGAQYINMAQELYHKEPVFKANIDQCAELIRPHITTDLREVIFSIEATDAHSQRLQDTAWTQPALFAIEYSLAKLLMHWGIQPQVMIGHSVGEYVAACIANVLSLEAALMLIAHRGKLISSLPSGSMLAVAASADELQNRLTPEVSLAVVNSPQACVVAGEDAAITVFEAELNASGMRCRRLHTSHAFHSHMMEAVLPDFRKHLEQVQFQAPSIPYVSNLTGTWITPEDATDPEYWLRHLRRTVFFADGIQTILKESDQICFEVGPGHTLTTLSRQQGMQTPLPALITLLPDARENKCSHHHVLRGLAQAVVRGLDIDCSTHYAGETRNRLTLPTYPFEGKRYWVTAESVHTAAQPAHNIKQSDIHQWCYVPVWKQAPLLVEATTSDTAALLIHDSLGYADAFKKQLSETGQTVISLQSDTLLEQLDELNNNAIHYTELFDFSGIHSEPDTSLQHLHQLTTLAQILAKRASQSPCALYVLNNNLYSVLGDECIDPQQALTTGPCRVMAQEYPHITCQSIDINTHNVTPASCATLLAHERSIATPGSAIAYRNHLRWIQDFQQIPLPTKQPVLAKNGVYWIIGGLSGIGLLLSQALIQLEPTVRLILSSRRAKPDSESLDIIDALRKQCRSIDIVPLDVTDSASVKSTYQSIQNKHGTVQGLIQAAGVPGGKILELHDRDSMQAVLNPKVEGTLNLLNTIQADRLDFIILCSSLAAFTGGIGQTDYVSANAYLDASAHAYNSHSTPVLSINWDAWLNTGMTRDGVASSQRDALAITPEEGMAVFKKLLGLLAYPQVLVSTAPLSPRLAASAEANPKIPDSTPKDLHARPALNTDYSAPTTELEQYWADTWTSILSIEHIGVEDNFFELGGDSLTALQLTAHIKTNKGWDLTVTDLYQFPTITALIQAKGSSFH